MFRSSRGDKEVEAAFTLLDQGDYLQGIAQLEQAERTFDLADKHFPEGDTLFGLYLRVEDWDKASRKLNKLYWRRNRQDWMNMAIQLIRASKATAPQVATEVASDILHEDEYLQEISYPDDIREELGDAMGLKLREDEYYDGFQRVTNWCDEDVEWWYYYADDGEQMHIDRFRRAINLAFLPGKTIYIDVFQPLPGMEADRDHIGLKGRIQFTGPGKEDSVFLSPDELPYQADDIDGKWKRYSRLENFDLNLFHWNTAMMTRSIEEPYYKNEPYLRIREFVRLKDSDILLDFATLRGMTQRSNDTGCNPSREIECWDFSAEWMAPFPDEFIELWIEKFPSSVNSQKLPTNRREAQRLALARDLSIYLENR